MDLGEPSNPLICYDSFSRVRMPDPSGPVHDPYCSQFPGSTGRFDPVESMTRMESCVDRGGCLLMHVWAGFANDSALRPPFASSAVVSSRLLDAVC
jgi:hypothetical protein